MLLLSNGNGFACDAARRAAALRMSISSSFQSTRKRPVRGEAFDRERPGNADAVLADIGLIVEIFEFGLGGD